MSYEGAIIGGYLLPHDEFVSLMEQLLIERKSDIYFYINKVLGHIYAKEIRDAYFEWEKFQMEILKNPKVELLAMLNYRNTGINTELVFTDEAQILTEKGSLSMRRLAQIEETLKNIYKYETIAKHLEQMINSIRDYTLTNRPKNDSEWTYIFDLPKGEFSEVKKRLSDIRWGNVNKKPSYLWIVYGSTSTAKNVNARGKMADAFLNHMGKMHKSLFSASSNFPTTLSDFKDLPDNVRNEENTALKFGFLKLLLESLNTTPWFTGGDLITVDRTGKVDLNIQLKTSKGNSGYVGSISYKNLATWLDEIINDFTLISNKDIAEKFYNNLKTSTVSEELGDDVIQSAYQLAAKELGLKFAI